MVIIYILISVSVRANIKYLVYIYFVKLKCERKSIFNYIPNLVLPSLVTLTSAGVVIRCFDIHTVTSCWSRYQRCGALPSFCHSACVVGMCAFQKILPTDGAAP